MKETRLITRREYEENMHYLEIENAIKEQKRRGKRTKKVTKFCDRISTKAIKWINKVDTFKEPRERVFSTLMRNLNQSEIRPLYDRIKAAFPYLYVKVTSFNKDEGYGSYIIVEVSLNDLITDETSEESKIWRILKGLITDETPEEAKIWCKEHGFLSTEQFKDLLDEINERKW